MEPNKNISLPEFSLVVLIGASGSGKSTFAKSHFLPTEILSSDFFRGLVSDDENNQAATDDTFDTLHYVAAKRLANLKLTVIDATNVQAFARKSLLQLAKDHHVLPIAIVLDLPEQTCRARNAIRADRNFGDHVIGQQSKQLRQSLKRLKREGFRRIYVLKSEEEINSIEVTREKVWVNRREETGPFDIIGDVHGCFDELKTLLEKLGYQINPDGVTPPKGRKAIFVGDLVDRGPKTPDVLKLVMNMVEAGTALCVPGNHDVRLVRALQGKKVKPTYGLSESLEQLSQESPAFKKQTTQFLDSLVSHYVLDEGRLVVAHAGMKEDLAGRTSGAVRAFAIYGETTGETDDFGLPIRYNWAADYRGTASIIYGHTPIPQPEWLNNTRNIDTGCVFGVLALESEPIDPRL
jgi:protein phosphatase